jgi:hypothetical protein
VWAWKKNEAQMMTAKGNPPEAQKRRTVTAGFFVRFPVSCS